MNKHPHNHNASTRQTCADCIHTFRKNVSDGMVVCVPHLKSMPANNSAVCDLYARRNPNSLGA